MIKPQDVVEAALLPFKVRPNPYPDPKPWVTRWAVSLFRCASVFVVPRLNWVFVSSSSF